MTVRLSPCRHAYHIHWFVTRHPEPRDRTMTSFIHWLSTRRTWVAVFAIIYCVTMTLSHDVMQQPAYWAQGQLSHRRWNNLVAAVGVALLIVFCVWLGRVIRQHERRRLAVFYLATTIVVAVLSFHTLLVMNIEVVHFPHYAILAVLLYCITRGHADTIILATLAGLIDEGYQYFYLYADRGIHFDFNDVILDTIGAGFGHVLIIIFANGTPRNCRPEATTLGRLGRSPVCITAVGLLTAGILAFSVGWIRILRDADAPLWAVILRRGGPSTRYWTPTTWGTTYHEVGPLEWLLVSIALCALYAALDAYDSRPERA